MNLPNSHCNIFIIYSNILILLRLLSKGDLAILKLKRIKKDSVIKQLTPYLKNIKPPEA